MLGNTNTSGIERRGGNRKKLEKKQREKEMQEGYYILETKKKISDEVVKCC